MNDNNAKRGRKVNCGIHLSPQFGDMETSRLATVVKMGQALFGSSVSHHFMLTLFLQTFDKPLVCCHGYATQGCHKGSFVKTYANEANLIGRVKPRKNAESRNY